MAFWYFMIRRYARQRTQPSGQNFEPYQTENKQMGPYPSEVPAYDIAQRRGELDTVEVSHTQELEGWARQ